MSARPTIYITGGTGYIGRHLIPALLERGHVVRALVRPESIDRVPEGAVPVPGDPLRSESIAAAIDRPGGVLVHLVGTPHPNPSKAEEFRKVDLASILAAAEAAPGRVSHLVYVSVAHPSPLMKAYVEARRAGEAAVRASGVAATVVRPWYVLGPGHWWPVVFQPVYALASLFPPTREGARRLGLVTIAEMTRALVQAVENPPAESSIRVMEVPEIRKADPGMSGTPDRRER